MNILRGGGLRLFQGFINRRKIVGRHLWTLPFAPAFLRNISTFLYGDVHKRRRQFREGRGQKLVKIADG